MREVLYSIAVELLTESHPYWRQRDWGLIWTVESMISHKLHKITFDVESSELAGAVNRLRAWPAFRGMGVELGEALSNITVWEVAAVQRSSNRAVFLIARSVTKEKRFQSYVAQGSLLWLNSLVAEEVSRNRRS